MSTADLSSSIRSALLAATTVTSHLDAYAGSFPIFTRRPIPNDAPDTVIVVSPDIALVNRDFLSTLAPVFTRDVTVYGQNDNAADYRVVETIAYAIRDVFHRNKAAITVSGWHVSSITASGPIPSPVDDDDTVGRVVTLEICLT